MKRVLISIVVLCCSFYAIAAGPNPNSAAQLSTPKAEITELEKLIADAKANGETPNPLWSQRIRELLPPSANQPAGAGNNVSAFQSEGGFAPGAVIRPQQLTQLEEQIRDLEFQIKGGLGNLAPDPVTHSNLKDQLNVLYAQRAEHGHRNPLDQGNDFCPGTVVTGIPYTDTGTTIGMADNYSPISPCNTTFASEVVYEFTPAATQTYNISLEGSGYDCLLYVNTTGACPGTSQVDCNDDWFGLQSFLSLTLNAGQTYFIIVDGYWDHSGDYVLNITDNCNIDCQLGDLSECEEFYGVFDGTDCDGGCNDIVPTWQTIYPCQTVCGRGFAVGGSRDTDWYSFTLTEACSLSITLDSEFPAQVAIIENASCPYGNAPFVQQWAYPCSTVTFLTQCLQPGTYTFFASPIAFDGIHALREYRARIDLVPCSGCRVDEFVQAPGSASSNTCEAGNHNSLRGSEDYTYCVNIPYESDWTFSICNVDNIWDSYIYLSTQCDGGVISEDDDGCGGVGLSVIRCAALAAGNYYLTVEGYNDTYCGPFVLNVSECSGSCCYNLDATPECTQGSPSMCAALGGVYSDGQTCDNTVCVARPACQDFSQYGQRPFLPGEAGTGFPSHLDLGSAQSDNYSVGGPIGSVRFWGFPLVCNGAPETFQVTFSDGPNSAAYTVTTTGTQFSEIYFGLYQISEYTVEIDPPCSILSGTVSVAKVGDSGCQWFWTTSNQGDAVHPTADPYEFAFCLGASCEPADSVTISLISDNNYLLNWWQPQAAQVDLYTATDPNAVYPAGFAYYGSLFAPAGHIAASYGTTDPFNYAVLILNCAPPSAAAVLDPNPVFRKQTEIK